MTLGIDQNTPTVGWQIQKEEIENCILELVDAPASLSSSKKRKNIKEAIPLTTALRILVNAINLFRSEPTMVEFDLDVNCIVVGDLHGYINDLLGTLIISELPPDHKILFLGDYVGRGEHQLDVLLLIILLKLRWPKYVYVLRGNHETPMDDTDGFESQCRDTYGIPEVYKLCTIMFDYMPIAAIIEDSVFCCHGGISQWAVTREAIKQIQRPVYYTTTPLLQMLIFTDLLWADPVREPIRSDNKFFLPSRRFASYMFTESALRSALDDLKCDVLIRGHEAVQNGITVQWHGNCVTVHTTTRMPHAPTRSSFVCLHKTLAEPVFVETRNNPLDSLSVTFEDGMLYTQLRCYLKLQFKRDTDIEVSHYSDKDLEEIFLMESHPELSRILNYTNIVNWCVANSMPLLNTLKKYSRFAFPFDKSSSYAATFPLLIDLILGKGQTFRTQITRIERKALEVIGKCPDPQVIPLDKWPSTTYMDEILPPS